MASVAPALPPAAPPIGWVTPQRLTAYSLILIVGYGLAIAYLVVTSHGVVDAYGRQLGTDFSDVWTAGRLALAGHPASAYDPKLLHAVQQAAFKSPNLPVYGWNYPPSFLLAASALALLPYLAALAAWQAATLPLYLAMMRGVAPQHGATLAAAAFPAVYINLTHGQNGFLTAALIGGALLMLERRPWVSGLLIGLLAYKPQFGVLLPLALLAEGRWKTIAAAAATVFAVAALTVLMFGTEVWRAFFANTAITREVVLEQGGAGFWKMQSLFAAARLWGAPVGLSYAVQAVGTGVAAIGVFMLWRSSADRRLKAAGLIVGTFLATPYSFDYDFVALAPAGAFLVSYARDRALGTFERAALTAAFVAPLVARTAAHVFMAPLGVAAVILLFVAVMRQAFAPGSLGERDHFADDRPLA